MMASRLLLEIVVTTVTIHLCHGATADVFYHTSVNFTCNNPLGTNLDLSAYTAGQLRRVWILPNNKVVEPGTITADGRVSALENGALQIRHVDDVDFGWYYCLTYVYPLQTYVLQKHGLNVDGPYFGDMYKNMVIFGLVPAAVCLVIMGALCFLYNRQQDRLDPGPVSKGPNNAAFEGDKEIPVSKGHSNAAFEGDTGMQATSHKKGPAPTPPESQELQDVVADAAVKDGVRAPGGDGEARTKL